MSSPSDRKYMKSHEWVKEEGGLSVVGLSDFAVKAIKDIVYLELPETGKNVEAGKPFGIIESVKAVFDLYSPVSGTIAEVNKPLLNSFETVTSAPYDKGWLIKVKASGTATDLMESPAYDKHCAEEHH